MVLKFGKKKGSIFLSQAEPGKYKSHLDKIPLYSETHKEQLEAFNSAVKKNKISDLNLAVGGTNINFTAASTFDELVDATQKLKAATDKLKESPSFKYYASQGIKEYAVTNEMKQDGFAAYKHKDKYVLYQKEKSIMINEKVHVFYDEMMQIKTFRMEVFHEGVSHYILVKVSHYLIEANYYNQNLIRRQICQNFAELINYQFGIVSPKHLLSFFWNALALPGFSEPVDNDTIFGVLSGGYVNQNYDIEKWDNPDTFSSNPAATIFYSKYSYGIQSEDVSETSKQLPGVMDVKLTCPVKEHKACSYQTPNQLWRLVQHINDQSEWTRENIADWLDELADDGKINIDFPTPEVDDSGLVNEIEEFLQEEED